MRIGVLFLSALLVVSSVAALGGIIVLDNKGKDFIVGFQPQPDVGSTITYEVHLTSDANTDVTIEYPVNAPTFITTVGVAPGAITIVALPTDVGQAWAEGAVDNNCVRLFADEEFICYMTSRQPASSDAALALPIDTFNTEFIAMGIEGTDIHTIDGGQFVVVAAFDNTNVTITPTSDLFGGFSAGVPFNIVLNRGEGFFARTTATSGDAADLTGSTVTADRPIGMTNGNRCANVTPSIGACDNIFEVAQPVQTWGNRVLAAGLPDRPQGTQYRVVASQDGTTVNLDGGLLANLNRGDFVDTGLITGNHVFEADQAIFVCQYMPGQQAGGTAGDPAQGNMIPAEQYLSDYTFSTVGGGQFSQNFLTVIAEDADVATILLDGGVIGAGNFTSIPGTGFSVAVLVLTEGTHTTSSNGVHGITVEGYDSFDSYIYPGGALFQVINPKEKNPPDCTCEVVGTPQRAECSATDNEPDDTGIFFVQLEPGSTNLVLTVDPFVPGDPMVTFTVELDDPNENGFGQVRVTDGDGNFTLCDILLEAAECFLVMSDTRGTTQWTNGGHTFPLQTGDVQEWHPVLIEVIPDIPINVPGKSRLGGFVKGEQRPNGTKPVRRITAQVVMWNPVVFPENPEQFTPGIEVLVWPDGSITSRVYGDRDNMWIDVEVVQTPEGRCLRFPFTIDGM